MKPKLIHLLMILTSLATAHEHDHSLLPVLESESNVTEIMTKTISDMQQAGVLDGLYPSVQKIYTRLSQINTPFDHVSNPKAGSMYNIEDLYEYLSETDRVPVNQIHSLRITELGDIFSIPFIVLSNNLVVPCGIGEFDKSFQPTDKTCSCQHHLFLRHHGSFIQCQQTQFSPKESPFTKFATDLSITWVNLDDPAAHTVLNNLQYLIEQTCHLIQSLLSRPEIMINEVESTARYLFLYETLVTTIKSIRKIPILHVRRPKEEVAIQYLAHPELPKAVDTEAPMANQPQSEQPPIANQPQSEPEIRFDEFMSDELN